MTGGMAVDKKHLTDQLKIFADKYNLCADLIRKLKGSRIFEFFISVLRIDFLD